MACEIHKGGEAKCVAPLYIRGHVLDLADGNGIEGAGVQANNPNLTPVGSSDITDGDGSYLLQVPAVRNEEGTPIEGNYLILAQAAGYQLFPSGIRQSLPLDATDAEKEENGWVIETSLSSIELIGLPGGGGDLGVISGTINGEACAGVLVIAASKETGFPGYSNDDCEYTIYNVPKGTYDVTALSAGIQTDRLSAEVQSGESTTGINLAIAQGKLATVSGNVQIVNAPGDSKTSVVLAVESTFNETVARGVVPPGLRAGDVTGEFTIENVPAGKYVVLAAFENDDLVRDPDESIGGTQIVHIEVTESDVTISDGFKVTEALAVVSPGADKPEQITGDPTLEWVDDSSEDGYVVTVYNTFGEEIWTTEVDSVSGKKTVTADYAGPALEAGMYYQFRVTSFKDNKGDRVSISTTEDLKGVFYLTAKE